MAGGRPKIRVEKPDWFDVNAYKSSKTFTAKQWAEQLIVRSNILIRQYNWLIDTHDGWLIEGWYERIDWTEDDWSYYMEEQAHYHIDAEPGDWYEEVEQEKKAVESLKKDFFDAEFIFDTIKKSPFSAEENSFDENFINDIFEFSATKHQKEKGLIYSHLTSLTFREAFPISNKIERIFTQQESSDVQLSLYGYRNRCTDSTNEKLDSIYDEPEYSKSVDFMEAIQPVNSKKHITINLASTDDLLIEQFKQWLTAARKEYGFLSEKSITEHSLRELHYNRVLAYIDLLIWSNFEGIKFQNLPSYYDLIFQNDIIEDKGQKMKNVIALAKKVLSSKYINALMNHSRP